jgi:lysophospholipase L1-like esterase
MADVNMTVSKRPLGRTLKDRLVLQEKRRSLYSPSSRNSSSSDTTDKMTVIYVIMAGFILLYCPRIIEPMTSVNVDAKNGDVTSGTRTLPAVMADVSSPVKENINLESNQHNDIDGNNPNKDKESPSVRKSLLSSIQNRPIRIFCYGDSLTAGSAPPAADFFPYAETLLTSLTDKVATDQKKFTFEVDHAGFAGWTAMQLQQQLISKITNSNVQQKLLLRDSDKSDASYYDILIYLAGTNDLGGAVPEQDVVAAVLNVHAWAHHVAKIPFTIALAIPPSQFQRDHPQAATRAAKVNQDLQQVIRRNFPRFSVSKASTLWAPFPISLHSSSSDADKEWWAMDGLHLSQQGYERLGEYLASTIYERMLR